MAVPHPERNQVLEALMRVRDPASGQNVVESGLIQGLQLREGHIGFAVEVAPSRGAAAEPLRKACEDAVAALPGVLSVTAVLTAHSERPGGAQPQPQPQQPQAQQRPAPGCVPGVGAIIAVASGKGGVGKSTVAVNLALGLAALGLKTGLLDADIYGPSVPRLLGLHEKPTSDGKILQPLEAYGIKAMSIGLLVGEDTPMIWRGPMVQSALTQMLSGVAWAPLDVLVVDMPPGTGDTQLTLVQRVALAGAVIVSTPQDIALIDARKAIAMFQKTEVPLLGVIENMSVFLCPNCGHESHIFGHGGARETAAKLHADFLGEIPLLPVVRETSDAGKPVVATQPGSAAAQAFIAIAQKVAAKLQGAARAAPKIVIE
jgi:ATP-binding protein involved in chromosome partitioning